MYLGGVINPLTLTIKRLIAAIPKIIKIIPAALLILTSPYSLAYSSATAYIVIVIVAVAEELLASVGMVGISSSGMLLSVGKVSDTTNTGKPASITTRTIKGISLFTISLSLYALFA
jgi:hypothetical protein